MFLSLKKTTEKGNERYYKIMVFSNLFDENILLREYGNSRYKGPTRVLENSYNEIKEAIKAALDIQKKKINKGYVVAYSSLTKKESSE